MTASALGAEWRAFVATPLRARLWTALVVLACAVPVVLPSARVTSRDLVLTGALLALAVVSLEAARAVEGGRAVLRQRPSKALSAWPFAAALLLPLPLLPLLVVVPYAWRAPG